MEGQKETNHKQIPRYISVKQLKQTTPTRLFQPKSIETKAHGEKQPEKRYDEGPSRKIAGTKEHQDPQHIHLNPPPKQQEHTDAPSSTPNHVRKEPSFSDLRIHQKPNAELDIMKSTVELQEAEKERKL
ncbi:hypothetical protein ISN44_As01g006580 [Arabidopsis suecica]|uniref:Uncharacterized protein n=1 Tax=Arabidopsis suecica TaxID=45249 RepID=A0A8T2H2Q3_ARASU|nr:hypothetical protein ISN44_As01g006580 [Arabidopsis suecica]